jgi:hypothetical protein
MPTDPDRDPREDITMIPTVTSSANVRTVTDATGVVFVAAVDLAVALLDGAALAEPYPDMCAGEALRAVAAAMTVCAGGAS